MNKITTHPNSQKRILYSTNWYIATDEYRSGFRSFLDYFLDEDARKLHEKKIREEINDQMEKSDEWVKKTLGKEEYKDTFAQARVGNIYKAYTALTRQSTVIISTLFETFIQEFFTCLFCLYPQRMYKFLILSEDNPLKGKIDLNEVLDVSSLPELIISCAEKASEQASKGKLSNRISNLENLTKNEVDSSIINKIAPIIEQRNKIVHEFTVDEIDPQTVMDYYETLLEIIEHLEDVAEKIGIETDRDED